MATLYVVATPIGNLQDLSPRAEQVLRAAPVVAAESLQRARKLLSHLGLRGQRLISCREANRRRAVAEVLEALGAGQEVALISDAGTPGLSDPGAAVVAAAVQMGHRVAPVAGPSALAAALSVCGLKQAPLIFLGFLPSKSGPRRKLLAQAGASGWTLALFEAPHRLAETAADLLEVLGDRPLVLARELTKVHEEVVHTTCAGLVRRLRGLESRGEVTLVVGPGQAAGPDPSEVDRLLRQGLAAGQEGPSALARRVAKDLGLNREGVYARLLSLKQTAGTEEMDAGVDSAQEQERVLRVSNSLGLHARAAAKISQTVAQYQCSVRLLKDQVEADAASVLSILGLDAPQGSTILAQAQGPQAGPVLDALEQLFGGLFGEGA
ncbi:MAG: 16S rRNA (cytidine(1402)-2'-O)-methyltransferase [Desulfarculus sp.]|nr:MAG: 16S rRNA (cytidine(1402)-2'-O)-methyltransferase [Desulfarculus sp.]